MSQQVAQSDVSASALPTAGTSESGSKGPIGLDGHSTDPSTSLTSTLLDSNRSPTYQSTKQRSNGSAITPTSESRHVDHQVDKDVPHVKVEEKARSSTIDEAVAKFHEAMGSDLKEPLDGEAIAPLVTESQHAMSAREGVGSDAIQETGFSKNSSNGDRRLSPKMVPEGRDADEPNFRRHTPTDTDPKRQVSESVDDDIGGAAAEATMMDEIDLN